jgi:hypothetical protein
MKNREMKKDMEQVIYTAEILTNLILVVRDEYLANEENLTSYYDINNGSCVEFAEEVLDRMGGYDEEDRFYEIELDMLRDGTEEDPNEFLDRDLLETHWEHVVPTHGLTWDEMDEIPFGHHRWLVLDNRHYDAECPEGVDNLFELPLFDKYIVQYILEKNYTVEILSQHIKVLRDEYLENPEIEVNSVYEINNGHCVEFAEEIHERMGGYDKHNRFSTISNDSFMLGVDGDKDGNDLWDRKLLEEHWQKVMPPYGLTWDEINKIPFGYHNWIVLDNRHYDAECPGGVENFFDLPLFKTYIDKYIQKRITTQGLE